MNIEESIEILKELKKNEWGELDNCSAYAIEAIETLLTAYEKEKEKNKKIKDILQKYAHTQVGDEDKILEFYRELKETFI